MKLFLSQVKKDLFGISKTTLGYSNFSKEEWQSFRSLADIRNIAIKKANKGLCVVVWDRNDYISEAEKQVNNNKSVHKNVISKKNILQDLAEASLRRKDKMTKKQLNYFTIAHKKATNLGKMYFLPKIQKNLFNVPGRPVILNFDSPREKVLEKKFE